MTRALLSLLLVFSGIAHSGPLKIEKGDRILFIGNTLAERMQHFGYFEAQLHRRFPEHNLVVRNLAWSADTVSLRPRPKNFGDIFKYLKEHKADVIIASYGFNESWDYGGLDGLERFSEDLAKHLHALRGEHFNGSSPPRLVLLSPLSCGAPVSPEQDPILQAYCAAMAKVAAEKEIPFLNLHTATKPWDASRYTINGVHLNEGGYAKLAEIIDQELFEEVLPFDQNSLEPIRQEVLAKNRTFFAIYRTVNSFYIHGDRRTPFGVVNFPKEREKLRAMTRVRDRRIWLAARGEQLPPKIDDSETGAVPETLPGTRSVPKLLDPREEQDSFVIADGFQVNLFASEQEFPDLQNPVAMLFDEHGRLWVSTMPSYPHAIPGKRPNDKILIFEDTDGDGVADKQTVFADQLYLPLGFELGYGGVFVSQEPHLVFLKDTDGDDKADTREILLHGFGCEDSHHAMHSLVWDQGGGLHMQESVFHHTQIETPYGPRRLANAGIIRFDPRTWKTDVVFRLNGGGNAWGHAIDRWGEHLFVGAHLNPCFVYQPDYPGFGAGYQKATKDSRFCEQEFITSWHFPDEFQRKVFSNIYKGYHGLKLHDWTGHGSTYKHEKLVDVVRAENTSHIPVDLVLGPRGALYIADWYNPVLGHMQYSLRDARRDHSHGRIWRVTYKDRPLSPAPKLANQSVGALLDFLTAYEDRTRYRARRLLWQLSDLELKPALTTWIENLDPAHADYPHHLCEALWLHQQRGWINDELLEKVLTSPDHRARAAGTHLLRYWHDRLPNVEALLLRAARDPSMKVRLEAVVSGTWTAPEIAVEVLDAVDALPKDGHLQLAVRHAKRALEPALESHPMVVPAETLAAMPLDSRVLHALIHREDLPSAHRQRAVIHLAEKQNKKPGDIILDTIEELDRGKHPALHSWLDLLNSLDHPSLATMAARLILMLDGRQSQAITRQALFAARTQAGVVSRSMEADYFCSIARISDPALRRTYQGTAQRSLEQESRSLQQCQAALFALGHVPGDDEQIFASIVPHLTNPELSAAAAEALLLRTPKTWPREKALELLQPGLDRLTKTLVPDRGDEAFALNSKLLTAVAKLAEPAQAEAHFKTIQSLQLHPIEIRCVPNLLRYDTERVEVHPGQPVALTLINDDHIEHNVLVGAPGSLDKIGTAADAMAGSADAIEKGWVPDFPEVLHHSRMLKYGETDTLRFTAPQNPGDYPFLCTFPGHWRVMKGILVVK